MLFLPLKEQGHQTTALPISSPPENTSKQANFGSCQLLHWASALECNCSSLYLRWARLAKWHSHSARCQLPRKLPNWHLGQGIRLVMSKRVLISKWKQESPSGLKNWRITKVGEDTSQLHASLKLTHPFSKSPIYRALSWGLGRLEFCASKEVLLVWV